MDVNERIWIEICTDNEEDWTEVLRLYVKSFGSSAPFLRGNLDAEKTKTLLEEYVNYIYKDLSHSLLIQTELSRGRVGLACVKMKKDDGSIMIVYAACNAYNRQIPITGDKSVMEALVGVENCMADDIWEETAIHEKIRQASRRLNFDHLYGVFAACHPDFMRSGVGRRFQRELVRLTYDDGVRRGRLDKKKPCLIYGITDDIPGRKFSLGCGLTELAHLHMLESRKCDEGASSSSEDFSDCIYVYGEELTGDNGLCTKIIELFKTPSSRL